MLRKFHQREILVYYLSHEGMMRFRAVVFSICSFSRADSRTRKSHDAGRIPRARGSSIHDRAALVSPYILRPMRDDY